MRGLLSDMLLAAAGHLMSSESVLWLECGILCGGREQSWMVKVCKCLCAQLACKCNKQSLNTFQPGQFSVVHGAIVSIFHVQNRGPHLTLRARLLMLRMMALLP